MLALQRRFAIAVWASLALAVGFALLAFPTQERLERGFARQVAAENGMGDEAADGAYREDGAFDKWVRTREADDAQTSKQAQAAVTKAELNADSTALGQAQRELDRARDRHQRWQAEYDDFRARLLRRHETQAHFLLTLFLLYWALPVAIAYAIFHFVVLRRMGPTRAESLEDEPREV